MAQIARRHLLATAAAGLATAPLAIAPLSRARAAEKPVIKIGVLTDMSGPYKDLGGPNVVICIKQAVQDFAAGGFDVEILTADHQNKPDVGATIARQWFDRDAVDCIADINNSAVAIALTTLCRERDKVQLNTGAGLSALTNKYCTPNLIHWTFDSYQQSNTGCVPVVQRGDKTWYFLVADYVFGHNLQNDATRFIEKAGGKVIGSSAYPFPDTTDYSSFLIAAQSSGAAVLGIAASGTDTINIIKQAAEFGVPKRMHMAALGIFINDVHGIGLAAAQGLTLPNMFYWDLNDRTRAFTARVQPKMNGTVPNQEQAGGYSGTLNYLKAVVAMGPSQAKASGRAVVDVLKRMPLDDDALGPGRVRVDGKALHPSYLLEVKSPAESHGEWDLFKLLTTVPAEQAFRPLAESECPLAKA